MARSTSKSKKGRRASALSPPAGGARPSRGELEVRRETLRGSGEKAARRDLESEQPLGECTAYQDGLQAAQGEAASNRIEHAVAEIGVVDEDLADVEIEKKWRESDVDKAGEAHEKAVEKRDKIPKPRRLGRISRLAYAATMALFAAAEYPLLKLSFTRLPADDQTIRVISVLVGAVLVAGVHVLALAVSRLVQAEGDRIEGRREWFVHLAVVVTAVVAYVFVVVGLAFVRAGEILGIGKAFGGHGVSQPIWFGIALGCLHGATLLGAFYIAYHRARGAEWLEAEKAAEERANELAEAEQALGDVERHEARLHVRREAIADQADHDLDRLLRHHQHEEAKYLAILVRQLADAPKPIGDWDMTKTPRARHTPPARSVRAKTAGSQNGKTSAASTRRIKRAVRDH